MSGVKTVTKQALHHLTGQRLVSIQEAVHMVDNQEFVISSNKMTYLSLAQGWALCDECDMHAKIDLITIYWNRQQKYNQLSLEQFFYQVFIQSTFNKNTKDNSNIANDHNQEQDILASNQHRILVPKGMNFTPRYPVDYAHAQGMLIMHKPWNKHNTLEHILNNKKATIDTFLRMIDRKEVPLSVMFQYLTAMKYAWQKKEILVKESVNHLDIDKENLDKEALDRLTGWIHNSHFTDNKLNNKCINDVTVDIEKNKDWSINDSLEDCQITIEGDKYLEAITEQYYDDNNIHKRKREVEIPKQKDGSKYSLKNLPKQQEAVVIAAIDTIQVTEGVRAYPWILTKYLCVSM